MGSLLITPFSCTYPSTSSNSNHQITMKAFTTIAALLGATYASPIQHIQYGSTGLRNINQHNSNIMMTNKDLHPSSTQHMTQNMAPVMDVSGEMPKPVGNPNQYLLKDNFGNYAFGYSTENSEMAEQGNDQVKKGHFANIMANGKLRRVDYVANDQGFHILRDTADNTGRYIKREAEADPSVDPDLIRTRMTSYMDSSSLRDNEKDLHGMSNNMMGRGMSSSSMRPRNNQMSSMHRSSDLMNHGMSSNMMGRDMSSNVMGHDMTNHAMSSNMMGRDMYTNLMSLDRTSNMMGHDMYTNLMGLDRTSNMMGRDMSANLMGHDMTSRLLDRDMMPNMMNPNMDVNKMGQTMYSNLMGHRGMTSTIMENEMPSIRMGQDISSNIMENRNMMGQDLYSDAMENNNKMMASNVMRSGNINQMAPLNRMSQRMQIETMPSQSLNRFF